MSASSTTSSSCRESEFEGKDAERRHRMEDCFGNLVREVLAKQESLQNKLINAIERFENERLARENEWRLQELARVSKEHSVLAHERAISAAKDAALLMLLQKISGEQVSISPRQAEASSNPTPASWKEPSTLINHRGRGGGGDGATSSSRWPKPEVEDLIRLRSNMKLQYHFLDHNGHKGGVSLWEEISSAMKKLGHDRSAKRCKEKWENINKYFKRAKASSKKRPQDSKTCPYFKHLESLYQKKRQLGKVESSINSGSSRCSSKAEDDLMQTDGQEQGQRLLLVTDTRENTNVEIDEKYHGERGKEEEEEEEEEDEYQIVASMPAME